MTKKLFPHSASPLNSPRNAHAVADVNQISAASGKHGRAEEIVRAKAGAAKNKQPGAGGTPDEILERDPSVPAQDSAHAGEDIIVAQAESASGAAASSAPTVTAALGGAAVSSAASIVTGKVAAGALSGISLGTLAVAAAGVAAVASVSDESDDDSDGDGGSGDTTAPTITSGTTANAIDENSGANQVVYTAVATDDGAVTYSLKQVDDYLRFTIDPATGEVSLNDNPDYETKSSYCLTIVATDAAGNNSEQEVTLDINDLDDTNADGNIMAGPVIDDLLITLYKADGTVLGSGTVNAADGSYEIAIPGGYVGPVTAVVVSDGDADFDYRDEATGADVMLTSALSGVGYCDGGSITLYITPLTTIAAKAAGVDADALLAGEPVNITVTAAQLAAVNTAVAEAFGLPDGFDITNPGGIEPLVNADGTANANVDSYGQVLALLSSAEKLMGDGATMIDFFVNSLAIDVSTINAGNPLVVELPKEAVFVMSMAASDSAIGSLLSAVNVSASDFQAQIGLTSEAVAQIDATAIEDALKTFSFADAAELTTRISAVTSTFAGLATVFADVDMPLIFTSPVRGNTLSDGETLSDAVYQVGVFDPDNPAASFSYSIIQEDTDDSSLFSIDDEGSVRFLPSTTIDFETKSSYTFTVAVTDGNETIERKVTLPVANVDDAPPVFTSADIGEDVMEGSGANQVIYTAVADDTADISRGVTYSLAEAEGTDYQSLSIDANTGEVKLLNNPDFESKNSYTFVVQADDGANPVVSKTVTVNITDVEEIPDIVLFDLVAGEDYRLVDGSLVANDEAQTFDSGKAYNIYIRMGTAWDTLQGDLITPWRGMSNLGADDHIFLIQDAGSERSLNAYSQFDNTYPQQSYLGWWNWDSNESGYSMGGSAWIYRSRGYFEAYISNSLEDRSKSQYNYSSTYANLWDRWQSAGNRAVRLFTGDNQHLGFAVNQGPAYVIDANGFPLDLPEPQWAAGQRRPDAPTFGLANDVGSVEKPVSFVDGISNDGTLNVFRVVPGATVEYRIRDELTGEWPDNWTTVGSGSPPEQPDQPEVALQEVTDDVPVGVPGLTQIVLAEGRYALGAIEVRQTVDGVTSAAYRNDKPIVVDQSSELSFEATTFTASVNENSVLYTANPVGDDQARFVLKDGLSDDAHLLKIDPITGAVTLASGDLPDYESGKTSYQFTVLVSDAFGNVAEQNEQQVTVDIADVANEVTVLFDLVNGEDYAGTDPLQALTLSATDGGSFAADVSYTIYISLPHIEDRLASGGIGVWSGIQNLGADDRIIFSCAAEAAYPLRSEHFAEWNGNYRMSYGVAGNPSGWWWGSHWLVPAGALQHSYSPNRRDHGTMVGTWYYEAVSLMTGTAPLDLGKLVAGVRTDGGPAFSFALASPTDADTADNTVAENAPSGTTVGITASARKGLADVVTYSLVNSDGTDYTGAAFQIDSATGIVSVGSAALDYEALPDDGKVHELWIKATSGTESTMEKFVLNVTDDVSDNRTVVLFDMITGDDYSGSSLTDLQAGTGGGNFAADKSYDIYIRIGGVDGWSATNINAWDGASNLSGDDRIVFVQDPGTTTLNSNSVLNAFSFYESVSGSWSSHTVYWMHGAQMTPYAYLDGEGRFGDWRPYGFRVELFNGGFGSDPFQNPDDSASDTKIGVFQAASDALPVFKANGESIGPEELVVLFDLTTGKDWVGTKSDSVAAISNDMVEKSGAGTFDAYKTYEIYIRVGDLADTHSDEFISAWRSAGTLGSDDKIYLVQAGTTASNDQYTQLTKFNANSGQRLGWMNTAQVGVDTYVSASARLFGSGIFNLNVDWLGAMTSVTTSRWDSANSTFKPETIQTRKDPEINQWFTLFTNGSRARLNDTQAASYVAGAAPLSSAVFNHVVAGQIVPI